MTKSIIFCLQLSLVSIGSILAANSGIHGNIQIQTVKTIQGHDNVDQLYGRANLRWAFDEKQGGNTTFSSLIHVRVYPSGFGYEPLLGSSFSGVPATSDHPAILSETPPVPGNPTIQMYQAWIQYKFTEFDARIGRLITNESNSIHFGNYLDYNPGGFLTFSRDGIHNAIEFFRVYKNFNTKMHLGIGDAEGNRGFFRFFEEVNLRNRLILKIGYRVNVFDLINLDWNDDRVRLTNKVAPGFLLKLSPMFDLDVEGAWIHEKGKSDMDMIPIMTGVDFHAEVMFKKIGLPRLIKLIRVEFEYLSDRMKHEGRYFGRDKDILWNLYLENTWLKRMKFQFSTFAAPNSEHNSNWGFGLRFTSDIN